VRDASVYRRSAAARPAGMNRPVTDWTEPHARLNYSARARRTPRRVRARRLPSTPRCLVASSTPAAGPAPVRSLRRFYSYTAVTRVRH